MSRACNYKVLEPTFVTNWFLIFKLTLVANFPLFVCSLGSKIEALINYFCSVMCI